MRFTLAVLGCVLSPGLCAAQSAVPRHDVMVSIGWAGSEYRPADYDVWRGSFFAGVSGGHYWTDHLKTEVEAGWLSRSESDTYRDITISGVPTFAQVGMRATDIRLSFGQAYQFGRNTWVHPFVAGGADFIRRNIVFDRPRQIGYPAGGGRGVPAVSIPAERRTETQMLVRPFLRTGLKMNASERTFFQTELKLAFAPDLDHAVWKLGFGMDF